MDKDKLRIELTPEERKEWWAGVAIEFRASPKGHVTVHEEWNEMDESFGDGCSITIPRRVWAEALPWVAARLAAIQ